MLHALFGMQHASSSTMQLTNIERFLTLRVLDAQPVASFEDARRTQAVHAALAGSWDWDKVVVSGLDSQTLHDVEDVGEFDQMWLSKKIEAALGSGHVTGAQARILLGLHAKLGER